MTAPQQLLPDAVAVLGGGGVDEWVSFEDARAGCEGITVASAAWAQWQVRVLRVDAAPDGARTVAGVRVTGRPMAGPDVAVTPVEQGIDLCTQNAGGCQHHSELRILVPRDAHVTVEQAGGSAAPLVPCATVLDVPIGYPVIVAVRSGEDAPSVPRLREAAAGDAGKPLRIRKTGSGIPQVRLERAGSEIVIRWPDRTEGILTLPPA